MAGFALNSSRGQLRQKSRNNEPETDFFRFIGRRCLEVANASSLSWAEIEERLQSLKKPLPL